MKQNRMFLTCEHGIWLANNNIADVPSCVTRCKKTFDIKASNLNNTQKSSASCHWALLSQTFFLSYYNKPQASLFDIGI